MLIQVYKQNLHYQVAIMRELLIKEEKGQHPNLELEIKEIVLNTNKVLNNKWQII